MQFADAIRVPVTDEASALAFLSALVDAEKSYHLEDSPHEIWGPKGRTFTDDEADLVEARVAETYSLDVWTRDDCPIGRMMDIEARKQGFESWEAMRDSQ